MHSISRGVMMARAFTSSAVLSGEVYDVAIVGAGMVGAAVAALLRKPLFKRSE